MNKYLIFVLLIQSFYVYNINAQCSGRNCDDSPFRSIDGSCNNRKFPWVGAITIPYKRLLPPEYDDNSGRLKSRARSGRRLPTPRDVSLDVHFPNDNNGSLSIFAVMLGQCVAHDISQASIQSESNGRPPSCENDINNRNPLCINLPTVSRDTINRDQKMFQIIRTAATNIDHMCRNSIREQVNAATSWLDLSVIYGSNANRARGVRAFSGGLLRTQKISEPGFLTSRDFLPRAGAGGCSNEEGSRTCFQGGESRLNENLVLISVQLLFVREHNRIAQILRSVIGDNDETLFQEARRLLIAEYLHILYAQWIPLLIGQDLMNRFGLTVTTASNFNPSTHRKPYDENVIGQAGNEFIGAAFRWGHSMLTSKYEKKDREYFHIRTVDLNAITFDPTEAYKDAGSDGFLRGSITQQCAAFDPHIANTPENHLFEDPSSDIKRGSLSTLSVQRGRDHGYQSYVKYREFCGLSVPKSWSDLNSIMPSEHVENLKKVYESVEDIELYPGGLSENPIPGAAIGPLFGCITAIQFSDWKKGDRFFYETDLNNDELAEIKKVTIQRLICDNIGVARIPLNPFLPPSSSNPLVDCSQFPTVDIAKIKRQTGTKAPQPETTRRSRQSFFDLSDFFRFF